MLSLTRIFLHNWHRFTHHLIEVEDSLYLAGHNGSGKSSVLDAIQLVLVADLGRIQFNKLAQDQSDRNLDTYVRGKIGEDRWLRPGNTVAYVALEFSEPGRRGALTCGVCLEAAAGKSPERTFFILPAALEPADFAEPGRALTRRDLKKAWRARRGAQVFDQVGEYQTELLNRLGGLNERFGDLFLRALHFRPIGKIDAFVEQWLLEKKALSLETLQTVRERLRDLREQAERVRRQLEQLEAVTAQQREVVRLGTLRDQYLLLVSLLKLAVAERHHAECQTRLTAHQTDLAQAERTLAEVQAARMGAEAAVDSAKRRLYESDVARQRDELVRRIKEATQEADRLRNRWQALRHSLALEIKTLEEVPETGVLAADDLATLRAALSGLRGLGETPPEPDQLQARLETLLPVLERAADRVRIGRVRLGDRVQQFRERGDTLKREIQDLERQGAIRYRPEVERLQDLLRPVVGGRPRLLCELLEVTDIRWQNAVEAMLGARRFNIIVAPQHFDAAVRVVDQARAAEKLYEVGLVDLERAEREARPAQPGSLATLVIPATALVGAYVNTILGDIQAVEAVGDLRRHRRAVTPAVVAYTEFTLRAVRPERYLPNFIGQQARRSQIESRQAEVRRLGQEWAELVPHYQLAETWAKRLDRRAEWAVLRERAGAPLDDQALRLQMAEDQAALAALDLIGLAELEGEVRRLERLLETERTAERQAIEQRASLSARSVVLQTQVSDAAAALTSRQAEAGEARTRWPEAGQGAETLLVERLVAADLGEEARKAESNAKGYDTRAGNETETLTELGTAYNTEHQFAARPRDPLETRYEQERERLAATALPDYQSRIQSAEREAENELREHVLHTLREQIGEAKRKLDEINAALAKLPPFGHETYRFKYDRADDKPEFYDLIMADSQLLGRGPLFESAYYREHQVAFDHFYEDLTRRPDSEIERREQERLTDYRRYLTYDIVVRDTVTGQDSRLSRIMNQTSGGETQTPFYLTIAASFVQLYHIGERSGRPTIRLVAFDEAFSKMDQERIGATLDLFQHFNLQIITATPLERCEYLVPKLCTSLVLTTIRDSVLIEPYRNYAARLNQADEQ
ncbi:MAG: AAA family ATPase [Anaerolineales bacterium]|nr:AAA family ATPase [Anaerolineales bacterium]